LTIDFKWSDNPEKLEDPISFALNENTAPNRRFNYRLNGKDNPINQLKKSIYPLLWACSLHCSPPATPGREEAKERVYSGCLYWPAYHYNRGQNSSSPRKPRWEIIRNAVPKEEGHQQPKVPLWGYWMKLIRKDMELKITTALEYGVNTFLYFDWYWFEKAPFWRGASTTDS
jgi:hypothetical protein